MKALVIAKKSGLLNPTRIIKDCIAAGYTDIQIYLKVKDLYPNYDEKKLRKLISVVKCKVIRK